jgi:nitroreductase
VHGELCIACGQCVAICPNQAAAHAALAPDRIQPIQRALLPSADQMREALRARRSIRTFKAQPVERALLEQLVDAARYAPSGHNTQSTQLVLVQDKAVLSKIVEATSDYFGRLARLLGNPIVRPLLKALGREQFGDVLRLAPEFARLTQAVRHGQDWILHDAPVLMLFHANRHIHFSDVNANLALHQVALMAEALRLGCFYTGFVVAAAKNTPPIGKLVSLPWRHQIYGGLAIGHPRITFKQWIERDPPRVTWT